MRHDVDRAGRAWLEVAAGFAAYVALFVGLRPGLALAVAALLAIPVLVAVWRFGPLGGLLAGLFGFPLNTLLLNTMGVPGWDVALRHGGAAALISLSAAGYLLGHLHGRRATSGERHALEVAAMTAIASAGGEATCEDELIEKALDVLGSSLGLEDVGVGRVDPSAGVVRLQRFPGGGPEELATISAEDGVVGRAVATARAVRIGNLARVRGAAGTGSQTRSELCVPMTAAGQVLGVIDARSARSDAFGDADERLLAALGQQLATGIDRLRHLEAAQRRAAEAETLREAGAAVTAGHRLQETIALILDQLERVVPYSSASVQLMGAGYLEIVGGKGWPDAGAVLGIRFPIAADNPNTVVVETRRPYILSDAPTQHAPFRAPPHDHIRSWLGVPMMLGERLLGLLAVDSAEPAHFTAHHAELVLAFASQVAIAVEKARLLEAAEQRACEAETLRQAGAVVAATLRQDEAIQRILEQLARVVPYGSASVQRLRDGELEIVGGQGWADPAKVVGIRFPVPGDNPNTRVIASGAPLILADAPAAYPAFQLPPHDHIVSWLGVPLIVQERIIGMLVLDHPGRGYFGPDHARLVSAFADQVAIAMENARLFDEARQLAVTDPLTGLYNRRYFFEMGHRETERARRYGRPLSALMLDIDHFKAVNDTYGHSVGDEVLKELSRRFRGGLRDGDLSCRFGGEEFLALVVEASSSEARVVAERIRASVRELAFATARGPLSITVSLGVAELPEDGCGIEALIDSADAALYAAKQAGRDRVVGSPA